MFLSIITPVYNTSKYLRDCLDSCLNQNLSSADYEIILIDDGSTDGSGDILDEYARRYSNLVVIHKKNEGVSVARNVALDIARGKYIWFIDSDDFIKENILEDIYQLAKDRNPELIQLNMYHMKSDYFTKEEKQLFDTGKLLPGKHLICSAIYRLDCINKNSTRFHPELRSNGDLVFAYERRKSIGGDKNVVEYEPVVYFYRNNNLSITNTISSKKLNSWICLSDIMHRHYMEDGNGFAIYTMVKYIFFSYYGIAQLTAKERRVWKSLMKKKKIFPLVVDSKGCEYYRDHYKTMRIKGVNKHLFRFIPTPIGYCYVWGRMILSKLVSFIRASCIIQSVDEK